MSCPDPNNIDDKQVRYKRELDLTAIAIAAVVIALAFISLKEFQGGIIANPHSATTIATTSQTTTQVYPNPKNTSTTAIYIPPNTTTYVTPTTYTTINQSGRIIITAINAQITYYNNLTGTYQTSTKSFPGGNFSKRSKFIDTFTFLNDGEYPYRVDSIKPTTQGFSFINVTPSLPYIVMPGSSLSVTSIIQNPGTPYAGTLLMSLLGTSLPSYPQAQWDEQAGLSLTSNFTTLEYNFTLVAQKDSNGCGPAYLLNGLSNLGYWYQIGVSYDWCRTLGAYVSGFYVNYQVFSPSGAHLYPSENVGGLISFNGQVYPGDLIKLDLTLENRTVVMTAKDINTGAYASTYFQSYNATKFVGNPNTPHNPEGFFTGVMTEWYHLNQYYGSEQPVYYNIYCNGTCNYGGWLWADQFYSNNGNLTTIFSNKTPSAVFPNNNVIFNTPIITLRYAPNGSFMTG
jgi:hypothetical protein